MRTFVFTSEKSHKFWSIERRGRELTFRWGRVGTAGAVVTKGLPDKGGSRGDYDRLIAEKLKKGYVETTAPPAVPAGASLRAALETAILDNPDDLSAHAAYADWLTEQPAPEDVVLGEY